VPANTTDQEQGATAISTEFSRYDQVDKPPYHLAESADDADAFDEDFQLSTCDISQYLLGNAADKAAFADELGAAMREIGFAVLEGHNVDPALINRAEDTIEEVFTSVDLQDKLRYRAERHGAVSEGYFPIKGTSEIHPDLVEGWVLGRRAFDLDNDVRCNPADFWASPHLESIFRELVEAELPLFQPIMQSVLQSLGCDPHLYDEKLTNPNLGLRLNYYPPINDEDQASGAGRLLGHEDIDLFTLLPAPAVDGLQALHPNGKWVRIQAPAGSIVMNTGDYMQRITNDVMPSTTHRVSPPRDPEHIGKLRVSIPLAAYLRPDEMLEVLPGLVEPKYDPIKVITFHTRTTAKFYGDDYAVEG
jgi:isopenicillin N synthase-like dioxygenase